MKMITEKNRMSCNRRRGNEKYHPKDYEQQGADKTGVVSYYFTFKFRTDPIELLVNFIKECNKCVHG